MSKIDDNVICQELDKALLLSQQEADKERAIDEKEANDMKIALQNSQVDNRRRAAHVADERVDALLCWQSVLGSIVCEAAPSLGA